MGKVLNPIVVNPKKEQIAKPYDRKDIEKLAYDVLADLGDEVINKAIEDGKIVLPENIDVSKLPQCPLFDGEDLPEEYAGKIIYDASNDIVWYPSNFTQQDTIYYFGFADVHTLCVCEFTYDSEEKEYGLNGGGEYNLNNIGGTKLYKHTIVFDTDAEMTIISTRANSYVGINQQDFTRDVLTFGGAYYSINYSNCRVSTLLDHNSNGYRFFGVDTDKTIFSEDVESIAQDTVTEL